MTSNRGVAAQPTEDMNDDPELVLPGSSLDEVATGRRFVRDQITGRLPDRTAEQMQLATSELVTNALLHGGSGPIELKLHVNDAVAWVRIAAQRDPAAALPPVDQWRIAELDQISGRGLGIVKAVSDRVDVEDDGIKLAITACFSLPS